jgi:hypothetical protein
MGGRGCHRCGSSTSSLDPLSIGDGGISRFHQRSAGRGHKRALSYQYGAGAITCPDCDSNRSTAGNLGLDFPPSYYCQDTSITLRGTDHAGKDVYSEYLPASLSGIPSSETATVSAIQETHEPIVELKTKPNSSKSMRNELKKTFLAFIFQQVTQLIMIWTVVKSNDRMDLESPVLPDIILDRVPVVKWAGQWSEILLFTLFLMFIVVMFFHKHRFLVLRRILAVTGICLFIRSFCVWATVLPRSLQTMECAPKSRNTAEVMHRVFIMYVTSGLSIFGGHMCGNYFFSGHTCLMTVIHCAFYQYTPDCLAHLKKLTTLLCLTIAGLILLAHNHYTLDVLGAYYVASRVWMFYHFLAHNPQYRLNSGLSLCWTWLVNIFEDGSDAPVVNELQSVSEIYEQLCTRGHSQGNEWKSRTQIF